MTTKCYYIPNTARRYSALKAIANAVPCFINTTDEDVAITCRDEDLAFVENKLAPLV